MDRVSNWTGDADHVDEDAQRYERAQHEDVTVGKVDQLDDAVHHGVPKGDQRVDGAEGEGINKLHGRHGNKERDGDGGNPEEDAVALSPCN